MYQKGKEKKTKFIKLWKNIENKKEIKKITTYKIERRGKKT